MPTSPGLRGDASPRPEESQQAPPTAGSLTSDDVNLLAKLSDVAQEEEQSNQRRKRFEKVHFFQLIQMLVNN